MNVVTRFAPSPTGMMHIGGVRTALFGYLFAKKYSGTFILRIEDTDRNREVAGSIEHIQESLEWLGISWDFGPDKKGTFGSCIQSERTDIYLQYARTLIEKGFAYPDPYTTEELENFRALATSEKRPFLFRNHRPEVFESWDGKKPLRFKVPEIKRYRWNDVVRGELEAGEEALDDFILMKSDGYPTYNFAHIVDDYLMGITHIFRGDEFISSTPRFLSLYEALDITPPIFVTLPPILREDKTKKLGKRDGAKDLLEYRTEGYLPEAVVNYLALVGWNPGTDEELFSTEELIQRFDIAQIQKSGGVFDEVKLQWFNRQHIQKLSLVDFITLATPFLSVATQEALLKNNLFLKIAPVMRERIQTLGELTVMDSDGEFSFFFKKPIYDKETLIPNKETAEGTLRRLNRVRELLMHLSEDTWHDTRIKEALWTYAEEEGRGAVLWPLRYSLSGRDKSPDPFLIASIIGKDETLQRIEKTLLLLS